MSVACEIPSPGFFYDRVWKVESASSNPVPPGWFGIDAGLDLPQGWDVGSDLKTIPAIAITKAEEAFSTLSALGRWFIDVSASADNTVIFKASSESDHSLIEFFEDGQIAVVHKSAEGPDLLFDTDSVSMAVAFVKRPAGAH